MRRSSKWITLLAATGAVALTLGACSRAPSSTAPAAQPQSPSASAQQPASNSAAAGAQTSAAQTTSPQTAQTAQAASAKAASAAAQGSSASGADADKGSTSLERIASMPAREQLPGGQRWKAGINYDVISPAQPDTAKPGKVEVMEVFWLGCPHCYALEPYLRAWLKKKPSYVEFVRVPVMWGEVHRLHAQLFYTLEALGRDDLVEKAFDTIHNDDNPLIGTTIQDTFQKQLAWAKSEGVSAAAFTTAYHSFGVSTSLQHAQEVTDRYHVTGVPMIIIDGKYSTGVGEAGGHPQLIELIDYLAKAEHKRLTHG